MPRYLRDPIPLTPYQIQEIRNALDVADTEEQIGAKTYEYLKRIFDHATAVLVECDEDIPYADG